MKDYLRANIAAMSGYVPGEQPKGRQFIKLNTNENPYPPSPAVGEALAALDWRRLRLYPDPIATGVRQVAADLHGVSPEWVVAGNGSDDLLTLATRALVDQGGALAFPVPSYSLYRTLADIQGARCLEIPLAADFSLPPDVAARAAGASLLFLARPNAPTGTSYPLAQVRQLAAEFSGVLLIDEAYADFAEDQAMPLVRDFPNVIVTRTFSKSYSLAGARFGYAVGQPPLITGMMKVKDSYNVNGLTQVIAEAALRDQAHLRATCARVKATRDHVAVALRELGFGVCPSQSNFLFVRPPAPPAAAFFGRLRQEGILVRYFPGPRTGDYLRISVGTDAEMAELLQAVRRILAAPLGQPSANSARPKSADQVVAAVTPTRADHECTGRGQRGSRPPGGDLRRQTEPEEPRIT